MGPRDVAWSKLVPHGAGASTGGLTIEAALEIDPAGAGRLRFLATGVERVRIPASAPAARLDGLWRHTCFEAFIGTPGGAYRELNFSPSGCWALYRFESYRQGMMSPGMTSPPAVTVRHDGTRLALDAVVGLEDLALQDTRRARLGFCAVIEDLDGSLSYWALRHAPDKPDFHDPAGFVLDVVLEEDLR